MEECNIDLNEVGCKVVCDVHYFFILDLILTFSLLSQNVSKM